MFGSIYSANLIVNFRRPFLYLSGVSILVKEL